ncbi:unnamed protein product [Diatraea saccharalis]|uniref:Uncharacterized protein n=1 Tax=Diatraea saccharalis TaxID=40085 RepID=A0A9N9R5T6_9NEOP|nr:unnamed protein product [Diatraea saccharalis]
MDFSAVCRTCLSATNLNPIFLDSTKCKNYSDIIFTTTGVKVNIGDGLPQNMCTSCIVFVNNSVKFRNKCRNIQLCLINLVNKTSKDNKTDKDNDTTEIKSELDHKPVKCFSGDIVDATVIHTNDKYEEIEKENVKVLGKETFQNDELPYREVLDANAKKQRVICKLCQKNLSIRSIDVHMARSHPGADNRTIKCELCDHIVSKKKLNRHMVMMHGLEFVRCSYCKCEFDSKESLIEHVESCTSKKKRRVDESGRTMVKCDICHKELQKASLRMHKLIKHAGQRPICEHCGQRLGNKFRLNEHYRAKHGYQKFKCTFCDFESASTMAIRNHERRHRGEKPFVCDACGAKFHAAYLLAQHKQSHRTDKQYKCDQCPATFKVNNSLHMHKLTCHSRALYKCGVCTQAYSCRHYAVKHVRRVHNHSGPDPPVVCVPIDEKTSNE